MNDEFDQRWHFTSSIFFLTPRGKTVAFIYIVMEPSGRRSLFDAFEDPSQLNQRVVKTRKDRNLWRMNRQGAIDRSETRDWARAIRVSRGLLMRLRCPLSPSFPLSKVIITRRKLVFAREARRKTEDCLPRPNRTGFQLRESAAAGSSVHNKFYYRLHRSQFTRHLNDVLMRPT